MVFNCEVMMMSKNEAYTVGKLTEGLITDEGLAKLRKLVGKKLRVHPYNTEATKDNIRHFCDGVGDPNPLWRDEEYAKKTRYGDIVAPPSWPFSVFPWVSVGLPGVHAWHSGHDWVFHKPIMRYDKINPEAIYKGYKEAPPKMARKVLINYGNGRYYDQGGKLVAESIYWSHLAERAATREKRYYEYELPHPWTEEEISKIEDEVIYSHFDCIRGSEVRFWEDVKVGDELPPLVKGPLTLWDEISFSAGVGPVHPQANGVALQYFRKHPMWAYRSSSSFGLEPAYMVHFTREAANSAGLPYPYDVGVQRNCWLIQLFTNWMGDEGWLKRCYAEYRRFVYLSDVIWIKGKVTKKYVDEDGEYCVDVESEAPNQREENTMKARATIVLPSRDAGVWPVERRLSRAYKTR